MHRDPARICASECPWLERRSLHAGSGRGKASHELPYLSSIFYLFISPLTRAAEGGYTRPMHYTPKTRRGEETKEKLLEAAERCFSEKGYFQTMISDITGLAETAPGTFYIYFEDKLSVFRYLMDDLSRRLRERVHAALERSSSRLDAEELGVREFFKFVAEHKGLYRIVWDAQFVDTEAFTAYYEGFAQAYQRRLGQAEAKGEVRELDLVALSYSLIGIANFVALKYVIFEDGDVPESAIKAVVTLLSQGAILSSAAEGDGPSQRP